MQANEDTVASSPVDGADWRAVADMWNVLRDEAEVAAARDPAIFNAMNNAVLAQPGFGHALAHRLATKLADQDMDQDALLTLFLRAYAARPELLGAAAADLLAIKDRDPAAAEMLTPFLYFKGFLALQGHRIAHGLWNAGRWHFARHVQSRMSEVFSIDIHPAAAMGRGIMLDHGSGIVIGETAVVEDDVSILQNVTLGGTGKDSGDRHPKIRKGVLIGAGAKILGNIEIGMGAKVGAGSVVVAAVAPYTSVVGVPARPVGRPHVALPGVTMDQTPIEPDYVI